MMPLSIIFVFLSSQLHAELQALNRSEISEGLIAEKLTLSKVREEDRLVECRKKDEEKILQRCA